MNEKLSYEDWLERNFGTVTISEEARQSLKELHDIDADSEVESAIRKEYEFYLTGGFKDA